MDGGASLLLMNTAMLLKVRAAARRAGYYDRKKDDFGRAVEYFGDIPIMDAGMYYNGTKSVDVIDTSTPSATAAGTSSIYAVNIALDGFHGISPTGTGVINSYMPDLKAPGAVKKGEVELVAGVVLKNCCPERYRPEGQDLGLIGGTLCRIIGFTFRIISAAQFQKETSPGSANELGRF